MNEEDLAAIKARQLVAKSLMEQGQQPLETAQIAGGYVVPVSPLQGLSKIAQALSGAYIAKQSDDEYSALKQKQADLLGSIDYTKQGAANELAKAGMIDEAVKLSVAQAPKPNRYQPTNMVVMGNDGKLHLSRYGSDPNSAVIQDKAIIPNNISYLNTGSGFTPVEGKGYIDSIQQPKLPETVPVKEGTPEFDAVIRQLQNSGQDPNKPFDGVHLDGEQYPVQQPPQKSGAGIIKKDLAPTEGLDYKGAVKDVEAAAQLPYKVEEEKQKARIDSQQKAYQQQQKDIIESAAKFGDIKTNLGSFDRAEKLIGQAEPYLGTLSDARISAGRANVTLRHKMGQNDYSDPALEAVSGLTTNIYQPIMTLLKSVDASPSQKQQEAMANAFGDTTKSAGELRQALAEMKKMFLDKAANHNLNARKALDSGMQFPVSPLIDVTAENPAQDPVDVYNAIADNEEKFNRLLKAKAGANNEQMPSNNGGWVVKEIK